MRVLVTGGTGFLGSRFIEALKALPDVEVFSVSRQTGYDLRDKGFLSLLPPCDSVVHLAQSREHRNFPDKALDVFDINAGATALLLDWSKRSGVKQFVLASTGNVYSESTIPHLETDPCRPANYYAATKYSAELISETYRQFFSVTALRIFTLYGPGQTGSLVPNLMDRIRNRHPITLAQGIGLQLSPLYIQDAVGMLIKILSNAARTLNPFEIYNLSGNETLDLKTMVEIIASELKIDPLYTITHEDVNYLSGNNQKFISAFDYKPRIDFRSGIKLILGSYGQHQDI